MSGICTETTCNSKFPTSVPSAHNQLMQKSSSITPTVCRHEPLRTQPLAAVYSAYLSITVAATAPAAASATSDAANLRYRKRANCSSTHPATRSHFMPTKPARVCFTKRPDVYQQHHLIQHHQHQTNSIYLHTSTDGRTIVTSSFNPLTIII